MSSTLLTGAASLSRAIPFPDQSLRRNREAGIRRFEAAAGAVERLMDFCVAMSGMWLAYETQAALLASTAFRIPVGSSIAAWTGFALLIVLLLERNGDYRGCVSLLAVRETERVLRTTLAALSLGLTVVVLLTRNVPVVLCGCAMVIVPGVLGIEKWCVQRLSGVLRQKLGLTKPAVIVGTGAYGKRIFSALVRSPKKGLDPVAFVELNESTAEATIQEAGYQHKRQARILSGPITPTMLRRVNAGALILADNSASRDQLSAIWRAAQAAGVTTYVTWDARSDSDDVTEYLELDGIMLSYRTKPPKRRLYEAGKRGLDVMLATLSLLFASPVLIAAAVAVKLTSSGPVIFRQERVGRGGRLFQMYKFPTMYADSKQYARSPVSGGDPRITRVGRILRHTCIDELPQLLNVLMGEMSLVGPRPEMPFVVAEYEAMHLKRLTVKPGITGLWQLSADRLSPIHENISYDLYYLELKGMQVIEAEGAQDARQSFASANPDGIVIDFSLSDGDGTELLAHFKTTDPEVPVIVLTGQGSIELAVHAIKEGAEQFLTKPVELPVLHSLLLRAIENKRIRQQSIVNRSKAQRDRLNPFLGTSSPIRHLEELSRRVVRSESPILIQGETGSGKGVLANWIHENSPRGDEVFMDLNCAGLEREFLETELFGHERGAFTGAVHAKPGLLEVADRGTVFLDEIGDIDLAVQPKLLKVLEAHQFRRLGDVRDRTVDIRLISATHRDLKELVRKQLFREDLFFRITIIPIRIPPLRERQEDIPLLANDILARIAAGRGSGATHLDPAAMAMLVQYPWPGNIREMHNVLERAAQIAHHSVLTVKDLELQYPVNAPSNGNGKRTMLTENSLTLREMESRYIEAILQEESGSIDRAARRLGISRSSLYSKVKNKEVERRATQC